MRRYDFSHDNEEPQVTPPQSVEYILGSDGPLITPDSGLDSTNSVGAFLTVGLNTNLEFVIETEVFLGATRRKERLTIHPDTTVPFLISVRASNRESAELADTAVALQGVITAGHRLTPADLIGIVFGKR